MKKIVCLIVLIVIAFYNYCSRMVVEPADINLNIEDFEYAWNTIKNTYQYLEFKKIEWDSLYTVYRVQADNSEGDEIYQVLCNMLAELKDGHVYYQTKGGGLEYPFYPPRILRDRRKYSPYVVRKYFNCELKVTEGGGFDYGIMEGNIGYIFISKFDPNGIVEFFDIALQYVKNTKGLIIDDRNGSGGNRIDVYQIVSRFLTTSLESPVFYNKGELEQWSPIEPGGKFQYTKPVVVIINGASYSGRELFADLMKQIPNITVVGDTTGGGSSGIEANIPELDGDYELPSGKLIHIPTIDCRRCDGLPWEMLGVPPDIRVTQSESDILQGRDRQLEYAIDLLK